MKIWLLVLSLSVMAAAAEDSPAQRPAEASPPITASLQLRVGNPQAQARDLARIQYSGALVQVARTRRPAQLINPRAPRGYGDGWANVSIDPVTKKAQGIKLFAITF